MKIEIIPEWRTSWKFSSVRVAAALALLSALQTDALPLLQPLVEPKTWNWIVAGLGLLIIVLRNVKLILGQAEEEQP
jgi:hypothetical protein